MDIFLFYSIFFFFYLYHIVSHEQNLFCGLGPNPNFLKKKAYHFFFFPRSSLIASLYMNQVLVS